MSDTPLPTNTVSVNLGEIQTSNKSDIWLVAHALGSCVAVCAFDPVAKAGAMAHVVLPSLPGFLSQNGKIDESPGKYADRAIPNLIRRLEVLGVDRTRLQFKMVGGSAILSSGRPSTRLDIGQRNAQSVLAALLAEGFYPIAAELGGKQGRTLYFQPATGLIRVRNVRGEEREY
jgi:chemotaxis protein CheD